MFIGFVHYCQFSQDVIVQPDFDSNAHITPSSACAIRDAKPSVIRYVQIPSSCFTLFTAFLLRELDVVSGRDIKFSISRCQVCSVFLDCGLAYMGSVGRSAHLWRYLTVAITSKVVLGFSMLQQLKWVSISLIQIVILLQTAISHLVTIAISPCVWYTGRLSQPLKFEYLRFSSNHLLNESFLLGTKSIANLLRTGLMFSGPGFRKVEFLKEIF